MLSDKKRIEIGFNTKIDYLERQITKRRVEINKLEKHHAELIEERKNTQDEYINFLKKEVI
jgi:hypothetical protein